MNQPDNQSIIIEDGSEVAFAGVLEDLAPDKTKAETLKGGAETVHLYLKSNGEDIQGESMMIPKPTSLGIK